VVPSSISQDAVQEFQVQTSAIAPSFDARLEVNDRTQAVVIAAQCGIVEI